VGTLTGLNVSGNVNVGNVNATLLSGYLATSSQPNVTSVGNLTSLTVSGDINISTGNLFIGKYTTGTTLYPTTYATTSNSWSSYTASDSGDGASTFAYYAFDNNTSTYWESEGNYNPSGGGYVGAVTTTYNTSISILGEWIQIQLPSAINIYSYSILGRTGLTLRSPNTFVLLGSNNGSTWTLVDSETNITAWSDGVFNTFTPNSSTSYSYYRLVINKNSGGTNIDITTWNLYTSYLTLTSGNITGGNLAINGYMNVFDSSTKTLYAGLGTEVNATIINFGINDSRVGGNINGYNTGLYRADGRTNYSSLQMLVKNTSGTYLYPFQVNSVGNVGIGTSLGSQPTLASPLDIRCNTTISQNLTVSGTLAVTGAVTRNSITVPAYYFQTGTFTPSSGTGGTIISITAFTYSGNTPAIIGNNGDFGANSSFYILACTPLYNGGSPSGTVNQIAMYYTCGNTNLVRYNFTGIYTP
jgi:hypothetical protein